MTKKEQNKRSNGPVITLLLITIVIMLASLILSILQFGGQQTIILQKELTTSLITVKNIFTVDGFKYIINNTIPNFKLLEPIVLLIISLIAVSICEKSGLLQAITKPFQKFRPRTITLITVFLGIISSIIGEYSYIILIPLVALIYKYLNKSSMLGIITIFLALIMWYSVSLFASYDDYALGILTTEAATAKIDPNYSFNVTSNLYIMLASIIVMTTAITYVVQKFIYPKFKKVVVNEEEYNFSKKGIIITIVVFALLLIGVIFMIIPNGILLDNEKNFYIAKLFSDASLFKNSFMLIVLIVAMICSAIYGFFSKNIKNTNDYSLNLSIGFSKTGHIFVLLFFTSILITVFNYTNIGPVTIVNLVEFLNGLELTGIALIIGLFFITILTAILVPSLISKWVLMSPVIIPLAMKANITPDFAQFIFQVGDSIGKSLSPMFVYFIIVIGFLEKYNEKDSKVDILGIIKKLFKPVLIISFIWLIIIISWYIIGIPTGISNFPTL